VVFLGNSAGAGGGLAVTEEFSGSTPGLVVNTLFSRNQATVSGSGLFLDNPSRPLEVVHCTFANPSLTPGDAIHATSGTMNVTNTIVSYFETGIIRAGTAIVTETYSLFSGNTTDTSGGVGGGTGSFIGVPDFLDPTPVW
jgi:hypothetical protein